MVVYNIHAHGHHQTVKTLGCKFFEKRILFPGTADTVNDIAALVVLVHEFFDDMHIVLKIRVHGNRHVRILLGRHQPGQQRVLMSLIPGKLQSQKQRILGVQVFNDVPGLILGTVIDKEHPALPGNFPPIHEVIKDLFQLPGCLRQNLLLVVAGNNHI